MEKVKKLYVALVVLFLYAPIGVLVAQSFNASRYRGHWTGFTLQWYGELFQNEGILDALQNTVTIGLSSAAIATVLGLITCMALRGMGRKPRSVFLGVASMPLLNADIVTGISLMLLFFGHGPAPGVWFHPHGPRRLQPALCHPVHHAPVPVPGPQLL